ncbi:hypothetical protein GGS24DRAFT_495735 [Hypoxylon argillaceum]|nr:hypothetical protein GGS24DRAFT_495735 [Hypoxylon argillaceum]
MQAESRDPAEIQAKGIGRVWEKSIAVLVATWVRTGRRWRMVFLCCGIAAAVIMYSNLHRVPVPRIRLEYSDEQSSQSTAPALSPTAPSSFQPQNSPLNVSKVALLIEDRPLPVLAPLLLHFISVVPPDWRFRFMGSAESVASVNGSHAVRAQVASGKLDLTRIPANASTGGQELISRFLTSRWLYETALRPAEWLLVFQTDSILCANSRQNLNDFLDYDWVGAPWNPSGRFGGNGGLSLRRVSAIIEVLRDQVRADGSEPEDVWLTERLGHRPGARMANGTLSLTFSGEMHAGAGVQAHRPAVSSDGAGTGADASPSASPSAAGQEEEGYYIEGVDDWRNGFYEPMGYHTGGSGSTLHGGIWGDAARRRHIWGYCPEVKMILAMDVAQYVPGDCMSDWKRDGKGVSGDFVDAASNEGLEYGTEIIDGAAYPMLPPNLVPW